MEQAIYYTYVFFMFITGLMFGSFFTLATYRIPRKQDIVSTRSYCPTCKHKLGFFDLIPVLSYLSTLGKCKYCKGKISIRYPLAELLSGFVFVIIFVIFGFSIETLLLIICYVYLYLVIGCDIMKGKMTAEEKKEVEKIKESKKKGAINIDVVIAMVVLIFYFIVAVYITSNYSSKLAKTKRQIDAINLCTNIINDEKALFFTSVGDLQPLSDTYTIDGVDYVFNVDKSMYSRAGETIRANAVDIRVTVSYSYRGETYSFSLKAIEVEGLQ